MKITRRQLRRVIQEQMQQGIDMLNWNELQAGDLVDVDSGYNFYSRVRIIQKVDDVSLESGLPPGPGFIGKELNGDTIVFPIEDIDPASYAKYAMTEHRLRRMIREAITAGSPVTDIDDFSKLRPGDRLTLNGAPIVVVEADQLYSTIVYVEEGKATLKDFDYRLAAIYPDDPLDLMPELEVVYMGAGAPPKRTRRPPRKRGPGHSYSIYD